MSEPNKKWVGYADLLEAKRQREEREQSTPAPSNETTISLVTETSQPSQTGQGIETSQPLETRQDISAAAERSEARQVPQARQDTEAPRQVPAVNLMSSLPDVKGHTRFQHQIVDYLYPQLDAYEQTVHLHLYRLSWGYNKPTCIISLQKLSERAGLSYKSAQRSVNSLEKRGLIGRQGRVIGYGKAQGIEFWVAPPSSQVVETRQVTKTRQDIETDNKRKNYKNIKETTHTKGVTQTDETSQEDFSERAPRGVSVGSKYSLEECLNYAEHLHRTGQGITNPGGFAMTVYRSGVADGLIEKFLNPTVEADPLDASACPDCNGTGFYYPKGAGHGVSKCRHERLASSDAMKDEPPEIRRLTPDEIEERISVISELLDNGYTLDQAENQFAGGFHAGDWTAMRERLEGKEV